MRVFIAHSMTLKAEAEAEGRRLIAPSHGIWLPTDPRGLTELMVHRENANRIKQCDAVFAIWNGVSDGCYGDVCMAIALGKPVYVRIVRGTYDTIMRIEHGKDGAKVREVAESESRRWALFSELPTIEDWWNSQKEIAP
jgi:nucleoside 2-deoxyribosyltransferase